MNEQLRQVGRRAAPSATPGGQGLLAVGRLNETMIGLGGGRLPLPKGAFLFRTPEEADSQMSRAIALAMARSWARQRG